MGTEATTTSEHILQEASAEGQTAELTIRIPRKLDIYVIVWGAPARIDWNNENPRVTATTALQSLHKYIGYQLAGDSSHNMIGHAAMVANYIDESGQQKTILFSNSGGNVGVDLEAPGDRNHASYSALVVDGIWGLLSEDYIANMFILQTVSAHFPDGYWESEGSFGNRLKERTTPIVKKESFTGQQAADYFECLSLIKTETDRDIKKAIEIYEKAKPEWSAKLRQAQQLLEPQNVTGTEVDRAIARAERLKRVKAAYAIDYKYEPFRELGGGPYFYGLNTLGVRLPTTYALDKPPPNYDIIRMKKYEMPDGSKHEIHGGCANAVASVLKACGLQHMITDIHMKIEDGDVLVPSAQFTLTLSFNAVKGKKIPILFPKIVVAGVTLKHDEFDAAGNFIDPDIEDEIEELPEHWVKPGDTAVNQVQFYDPSVWYDQWEHHKANTPGAFEELRALLPAKDE